MGDVFLISDWYINSWLSNLKYCRVKVKIDYLIYEWTVSFSKFFFLHIIVIIAEFFHLISHIWTDDVIINYLYIFNILVSNAFISFLHL